MQLASPVGRKGLGCRSLDGGGTRAASKAIAMGASSMGAMTLSPNCMTCAMPEAPCAMSGRRPALDEHRLILNHGSSSEVGKPRGCEESGTYWLQGEPALFAAGPGSNGLVHYYFRCKHRAVAEVPRSTGSYPPCSLGLRCREPLRYSEICAYVPTHYKLTTPSANHLTVLARALNRPLEPTGTPRPPRVLSAPSFRIKIDSLAHRMRAY